MEDEALAQMRAAIELAPGYFPGARGIGGRLPQPQSKSRIALKLDPYYRPGREIQAIVWFFKGWVRESAATLVDLAKQSPNRILVQYYWGRALVALGNLQEGAFHFQQVEALVQKAQRQLDSTEQRWNNGAWLAPPGFLSLRDVDVVTPERSESWPWHNRCRALTPGAGDHRPAVRRRMIPAIRASVRLEALSAHQSYSTRAGSGQHRIHFGLAFDELPASPLIVSNGGIKHFSCRGCQNGLLHRV